jgi:glycosyltransferase involved in cell wall biosynthesis
MEATVVLYVGRLIQEKGVTELLEAFAAIGPTNTYLVYVGDGDQQQRIKLAANTLGVVDKVRVLPGVPYRHLPKMYASADIVAAPSLPTPYWEEQFGMVLVEAMACGRPLITTDSGAISEVVGDAARVVAPYEHSALTEALLELLTDDMLRAELGSAGFARARELYAVPVVAPLIADAYAAALAI